MESCIRTRKEQRQLSIFPSTHPQCLNRPFATGPLVQYRTTGKILYVECNTQTQRVLHRVLPIAWLYIQKLVGSHADHYYVGRSPGKHVNDPCSNPRNFIWISLEDSLLYTRFSLPKSARCSFLIWRTKKEYSWAIQGGLYKLLDASVDMNCLSDLFNSLTKEMPKEEAERQKQIASRNVIIRSSKFQSFSMDSGNFVKERCKAIHMI